MSKAPDGKEIDPRFMPTVINILKTGEIAIANGCGEWYRFPDTETAVDAVRGMIERKIEVQNRGLSADIGK